MPFPDYALIKLEKGPLEKECLIDLPRMQGDRETTTATLKYTHGTLCVQDCQQIVCLYCTVCTLDTGKFVTYHIPIHTMFLLVQYFVRMVKKKITVLYFRCL